VKTAHKGIPGAPGGSKDPSTAPSALFLGAEYAGHATRFRNLRDHAAADPRLHATFRSITGWRPGGLIERAPLLPGGLKGKARATWEARAFAAFPRPDVIWTSAAEVLVPFLWAQVGPLRRPLVLDLDATDDQNEAMAPVYAGRPPRTGLHRAFMRQRTRALYATASLFLPWSRWAADGLAAMGIDTGRVQVIPPGVDLSLWAPVPRERDDGRPLRLLFVGGDFVRKGGDLLVAVCGGPLAGEVELDIVTRDAAEGAGPNVRIHRAEPNSPLLRELYARADVFVMPTRAECFGIATVEAMASGLPVIVGDIGGARDIVVPGETGWLIEPEERALVAALRAALADRPRVAAMGAQARRVAESRFDGRANDRRIVDAMLALLGD
jgi:glycosyltransferase involved in cell wall biosynthesis